VRVLSVPRTSRANGGSKLTPLVDVVIPTYNRRGLLPRAIASIRAQTVPVNRIYIVDDGSQDGTVEWMRSMTATDHKLVLIERRHGGANLARNAGIARSQAEWIAFLDSDDTWEPDKLERQFALLKRKPDLIGLFCGFRLTGGQNERIHLPRDDPSLLDLRCANALGGTSAAVVRATALREVGNFNSALPSCQDWDLWFRLRQIGRLGVVRAPLVNFNSGPHDRITTNLQKVLSGHKVMFAQLLADVSQADDRAKIHARHKLVEADIQRRFGAHQSALKLALSSFVHAPSKWALAIAWRAGRAAYSDFGSRTARR
jgi:glycosyltransferase involved in cell wall biosynthesis